MKQIWLTVIFIGVAAMVQAQQKDFESFALRQDSLIKVAYEQKDPAAAETLCNDLYAAYIKLSAIEQTAAWDFVTGAYYNTACVYAIAGNKEKALSWLEKSKYYDYDHVSVDADLMSLHKEPRFKKFLAIAKSKKVSYLTVLQQAKKYNINEQNDLPAFTYQDKDFPKLAALRKKYNLDSIAGYGNDVSRMINLMRWVHNLIPHNGSKGNPDTKNALSLIKECRRDGKTLNCRGLAIVLNEVYLAAGFQSGFVTCLPKDPNDNDCHVITSVYSQTLRKWVWMDPTFMAYVMNERGELLSIEEVRERLISKKPLILNPDAMHNNRTSQTKADYLENYMAKNLYRLQCPVDSRYDLETPEKDKVRAYIDLVPGGSVQEPYTSTRKDGMSTIRHYFTANPRLFWQVPPGQSAADFDAAMAQIKKNYNNTNDEGFRQSFSDQWSYLGSKIWPDGQTETLKMKNGELLSFKRLGAAPEDGVMIYKAVFAKSTHAMGLTLDGKGKLLTFRFETTSPEIEQMMAGK